MTKKNNFKKETTKKKKEKQRKKRRQRRKRRKTKLVRLTDAQWERIKPHLPKYKPSAKGGRPPSDDREVLEGILWMLRTGARWQDLPGEYPSPSTCWRRLKKWQNMGIWEKIWQAFLAELDAQGKIDWEETSIDGSFAPAKKGGKCVGKTKKGKGTKLMVVVEGREGIPMARKITSASPAECKLAKSTMDNVRVPRKGRGRPKKRPKRTMGDKAYDSDPLRKEFKECGIELICPHRKNRKKKKIQDGRKLRRYKRRWKVERTFAWLGNYRHLLIRHERYVEIYDAFFCLACAMIALNWVLK